MSKEEKMTCSDAKDLVYRTWIPKTGDIRAILHIFHGMAEHGQRYDRFAKYLNTQGIAVYAQDHRGHGKTTSGDELGWFAESNGWFRVVQDGYELSQHIRKNHPGKNIYLLGHSMGSFLVRSLIVMHPELYKGAIISGTGASQGLMGKIGRLIATIRAKIKGGKTPDALLDKLSFGNFGKTFQPSKTTFDWLSRDEKEVQAYIDDPLCGFVCSSQFFVDLLDGIDHANDPHEIAKIPKEFPLYFISGEKDPVGDFGSGVRKAFNLYKDTGMVNLTLELIPEARHELLNEVGREKYQKMLAQWILDQEG